MRSEVVNPPKLVTITGFGSHSHGLLVEWRRRKRGGREMWEGLVVHVVSYGSQEGEEWSIRVDWLRENQFKAASPRD